MSIFKHKDKCTHCETGRLMYELDKNAVICPYIQGKTSIRCAMYKPAKKTNLFARIFSPKK